MTKLILEEHGKRRAFKLGDGLLTVGSGESATLRLESQSVAEVHLELEITGEKAIVKPRAGVVPPRIGGEELKGSRTIEHGERVELGEVTFWIEVEGKPAASAAPAKVAPVKKASGAPTGAKASAGSTPRRQIPKGVATPGRDRSVVQRSRPRVQRGMPGWLIAALTLAVVAVAVAVVVRGIQSSAGQGASPVFARIQAAERLMAEGMLDSAESRLDSIGENLEVSDKEKARIAALRKELVQRREDADVGVANLTGTKYLEVMLKKYEKKWLEGDPDPAKVRYFMQRLAEFRRRWPSHPDMDWVERQETRFRGFVDLKAPPTWDDIAWEIRYIREQSIRQYSDAFALLEDFEGRADEYELAEMADLRREMEQERREYHEDRIQQARYDYETKGDPAKAVWWLLNLTIYIGDEEMANQAAEFLVKMPDLEAHLDAYKRQYPERYSLVLQHPLVKEKARTF